MSLVSGAKARILVVDDSRLMRKAALKMLGEEFDVITAEDGDDAWGQIGQDHTIQVVFTDLNMPNCDGYDLLRRVRTADDGGVQSLPVIVVTGAENDESARMQALDLGATDFITKPFTTTDLVARARAHANNQRITRQLQAQTTLDALTGLANQAGFLDRLQQDIAFARRHQNPISVVRLEIEDFRRFFLYHGRDVAQALVLQLARLLRARIRKEDTAARIGLGGFALSLPGGEQLGIEGMLSRLRAELETSPPLDEDGQPIAVRLLSAVVSPVSMQDATAQALLEQCEAQLEGPAAAPVAAASSPAPVVEVAPQVEQPAVADHAAVPEMPTAAVIPAPAEPPAAAPAAPAAAAGEALRLDPLLDQMAQGNPQPLLDKLPQFIGRLLPVFRLLGPNQRAQLIQFLQRLGS